MLEPITPPSPEDELMISPLPPRGLHALARSVLDTSGRLVAGALICALALVVSGFCIFFWTYGFRWLLQLIFWLLSPFFA